MQKTSTEINMPHQITQNKRMLINTNYNGNESEQKECKEFNFRGITLNGGNSSWTQWLLVAMLFNSFLSASHNISDTQLNSQLHSHQTALCKNTLIFVIALRAKLSSTVYCNRSCLCVGLCHFLCVCLFVSLLPR